MGGRRERLITQLAWAGEGFTQQPSPNVGQQPGGDVSLGRAAQHKAEQRLPLLAGQQP